jgi:hypothetical protein
MNDEIMKEIWKNKDEIARENSHDIDKLAKAMKKKEKNSGHKVIDLSKTRHPVAA